MRHLALLALACAGCGFSFERSSELLDRRVLAMQAEPPEIVVDPTTPAQPVRLRALVVDPKEPGGVAQYEWRACSPVSAATYDSSQGRCVEDASTLLESGAKPLPELAIEVAVPPSLLEQVAFIGAAGQAVSLYVHAQLRVDSDAGPLYASDISIALCLDAELVKRITDDLVREGVLG